MATGTTRNGKPCQVGDLCTIVGTIVAITGSGGAANVTVQCQGALEGAPDPTQNAYTYSIGVPLAGGTLAPATGVYAADLNSAQTL
jgi:hypothetical protein